MRYFMCALAILTSLTTASPASAASFTADIDGKRITIEQPWYLYTHGETGIKQECLFFSLIDVAEGVVDIKGDGFVYEFPVAEGDVLPTPERIRDMDAEQLRGLVRELDRKYTQLSPADSLTLAEINGFTAIVRKDQKKTANDPFQFRYYFPLRDRLVFLTADVYGTAADAALLESICSSFIPDTSPAQDLNTVSGDGVTLSFPRTWSVVMRGFTDPKDSVWATLEKYTSEDEKRVARVSVLGPIPSVLYSGMERPLADPEWGKQLAVHALGSRILLQNVREISKEIVTVAPRLLAKRHVVRGEADGKEVELTFQQIPKSGRLLTVISGTVLPISDETRQELETIYASLKIEDDGPEITKHLDMSFFELLRYLKENRPVTHQTLTEIGFSGLHKDGGDYTGEGILLSDGNSIRKIELREHKGGSFLTMRLGENTIKRDDIESEFGEFRLFAGPKGKSIDELILYGNDTTANFTICIGLDQTTREPRYFSIDSPTPKITEHLDMSFFELLRYLKAHRPVTSQTVVGLDLADLRVRTSSKGSNYKANGITLSDGTVIAELELREHEKGALFVLPLGEHNITREALEAELGEFRLRDVPRGKSIHERIVYVNDSTENFVVMIGLDQTTRELRGLSIRNRLGRK